MEPDNTAKSAIRNILDAIPALVFAVDSDVRIIEYNSAAAGFLDSDRISVLFKRAGDALHCMHSLEGPEGCGHAPVCEDCVIRNSVYAAIKGEKIVRKRVKLEISSQGSCSEIFAVLTASPFVLDGKELVLLLLEDISELLAIQEIVQICMKCKKVQSEGEFWSALEAYFKNNWGIDFSHGYCPACAKEEMKKIRDFIDKEKS